jgi:hypothetical protein
MKTLCIRRILWVFSVLFIQQVVQAQTDTSARHAPVSAPAVTTPAATTTSTITTPLITIENGKTKKPKVKKKWRYIIDADAGFASPANTELSDVFKGGLNASLGIKTAFFDNKLWVRPVGGLKYYFKKVELSEPHREAFLTWKAGVELQYQVYTVGKFTISPILRADNNWSSSQFTKTGDEKNPDIPSIQTTGKLLTGTGVSFSGGVMVVRSGDLYVKLNYEYYKPDLTVNPDYVSEMLAAGIIVPANKVYDCSSINLSVGVNLNFKK